MGYIIHLLCRYNSKNVLFIGTVATYRCVVRQWLDVSKWHISRPTRKPTLWTLRIDPDRPKHAG